MQKERELELYLHIPFCVKKCDYCDFLSAPCTEEEKSRYLRALQREILHTEPATASEVVSVFFGGGTPSLLSGEEVDALLEVLSQRFFLRPDAEITLEANPGTLTKRRLADYRSAGINRLSLGLQSTHEEELRLLGRIHSYRQFLENFWAAREAGFDNINVDLMSALPGQTLEKWEKTLHSVAALSPEHISAYSLIIEEGTPFYERYAQEERERQLGDETRLLPSEEEERAMYRRTGEILADYGYHRYEISNYAREGRECLHNKGYWQGRDYLGFGLGAASLREGVRYSNVRELSRYLLLLGEGSGGLAEGAGLDELRAERSVLTEDELREEFFFLGLRLQEGVAEADFCLRFGESWEPFYGKQIRELEGLGLLQQKNGRLFLTEEGISVSNEVFLRLLL